jgi:hypothetical protein
MAEKRQRECDSAAKKLLAHLNSIWLSRHAFSSK